MLICRLFLSSGSLPSTLSSIPLMVFLQPKGVSVHSWFCTSGDHHGKGWLWACSLRGQLGMEACGAVAKSQNSGLATDPPTTDYPTSVCEGLQERWEVGLVWFSSWVVDHSEDVWKYNSVFTWAVWRLLWIDAISLHQLLSGLLWYLSLFPLWKHELKFRSCPQNSNSEILQVDCFPCSSE